MRKQFLFLFMILIVSNTNQAQTRGTKIGYIDMEYILQNVPDYTDAQNQLEQKAQKWKQEIETKKIEINKLKDALKAEKALLTKGLIEERETEIKFLEDEMLEYQQKRFGPNGDLIIQKSTLTKPIQDQVFGAIQDIAEAKKYDFIFDKSSDLTMLFTAKRFDVSDQVLRIITRTDKREQLTKKQLKQEEAEESKEDAADENPALANRQKALDAKKEARDKIISERKKAAEDKRNQILSNRGALKTGTIPGTTTTSTTAGNVDKKETAKTAAADTKQKQIDARAKILEDRKKAAEERRLQILKDRETQKVGAVPSTLKTAEPKANTEKDSAVTAGNEAKQKQIDERAKILEDRKKVIENNKKAAEEKRKQVLEERETKKTGTISDKTTVEEVKTPDTVLETVKETPKTAVEDAKQKQIDARAKTLEDRKKIIEDRKKAVEEKRKKTIEDREAAIKAKTDTLKITKENSNNN